MPAATEISAAFGASNPPSVTGEIFVTRTEDTGEFWIDLAANAFDPDLVTILRVVNLPASFADGLQWDPVFNVLRLNTNHAAFQALGAGQSVTFDLTYGITDGIFTVPDAAHITVVGTNDLPIIGGIAAGSVTEDEVLTATGALLIVDADAGESGFQAGVLSGGFGSLALDATGNWTYTLDNSLASVQALSTGDTMTEVFTVQTIDGTATQIAITVSGADEPFVTLSGTEGADTITGGASAEFILGRGGNDRLVGNDGNDTLDGGAGADSIYGGAGNDIVFYSAQDRVQNGGLGIDTLVVASGATINLGASDQVSGDSGTASGFENIDGSGATAALVLTGSTAANWLEGGSGNDRITGSRGADVLTGSGGGDRFVFSSLADSRAGEALADRITDFQTGVDKLDLTGVDAISGGANNAFRWIGSADFAVTGSAGQLRYDAMTGLLEGDVNGDRVADFQIIMESGLSLTAADILL